MPKSSLFKKDIHEPANRNIFLFIAPLFLLFVTAIVFVLAILINNQKSLIDKQIPNQTVSHVLGASTIKGEDALFFINLPAQFNRNVKLNNTNLDAGTGQIYASNLLYSLTAGDGISITGGQNPIISNTSPATSQNIYKNIKVGSQTISAQNNNDTLEFLNTGSVSIKNGKIAVTPSTTTVNNITNVTNSTSDSSGFIKDTLSNSIKLQDNNSSVVIGSNTSQGKLTINSTNNSPALVVQSFNGQTADISDWKDYNGNSLVSFDNTGNVVIKGAIAQSGSGLKINGDATNVVFDANTSEPTNILLNSDLEADLQNWSTSTPTAVNVLQNPGLTPDLSGWQAGNNYPEQLLNPGFEQGSQNWTGACISQGSCFSTFNTSYIPFNTKCGTTISPCNQSIVADNNGNVYIELNTDYNFAEILKIAKDGTESIVPDPLSTNNIGYGGTMLLDSNGNIWQIGRKILSMINTAQDKVAIQSAVDDSFNPTIAQGGDGNIYFTTDGGTTPKLWKSDLQGNVSIVISNHVMNHITKGPDGNIWFDDYTDSLVGYVTPSGTMQTYSVPFGNTSGGTTSGLIFGPDGNLWALGCGSYFKISTAGTILSTYTNNFGVCFGQTVIGPDNKLWSITGSNSLIKVDMSGTETLSNLNAGVNTQSISTYDTSSFIVLDKVTQQYIKESTNSATPVNTPTHNSSTKSLKAVALTDFNVSQSVATPTGVTNILQTYAYIDGSTPTTSSIAQLSYNGSVITTNYINDGGGWYKLWATIPGDGTTSTYGVIAKGGNTIYLDDFSLKRQANIIEDVSHSYTTAGSAFVNASSSNIDFNQIVPLSIAQYTFTIEAYNYTSPITTNNAQISLNGTTIATTISSSSKPNWYTLTGSFTSSAEASVTIGVITKNGNSINYDDATLLMSPVPTPSSHNTDQPAYTGTGSATINTLGTSSVNFYQSTNAIQDMNYAIKAEVYIMTPGQIGSQVTSSIASLSVNGNPVATTYIAAGNGWYTLTSTQYLTQGSYNIGVIISSNQKVRLDDIIFLGGTGANKTISIINSGSGLAFLSVESTTTLHTGNNTLPALVVMGETNQTANLAQFENKAGNILSVFNQNGQLGIGVTNVSRGLVVNESDSNSSPVAFVNKSLTDSASTSALKLSLGTTGTSSRFIQFYAGATDDTNGTGVGEIRLNGNGVAYESGNADFAEYFSTSNNEQFMPGDVVDLNKDGIATKSNGIDKTKILGIVSNSAAFVGNTKSNNINRVIVGLIGQLRVKASDINGNIHKGDYITSSNIIGFAKKASLPDFVIGQALSDLDNSLNCSLNKCGYVDVFVRPQWINSQYNKYSTAKNLLSDNSSGIIQLLGGKTVIDDLGNLILKEGSLKIQNGVIEGNSTFTGTIILHKGENSIAVEKSWNQNPKSINLTPEYNTKVWVDNISASGFTIHVDTPPATDSKIDWTAIF